MTNSLKALALISGGLDSMLAVKVIQEQGIHVEGINFFTGFCVEGHTHAIRKKDKDKVKRNNALWVAEQLGIKLHIVDVTEPYRDVVINPKHGYGKHLNPCLDCKIFMVNKALEWARDPQNNFDFIITGEVVGQRPMSQRADTLPLIATDSGAHDLLLRPLCAKHLQPTLPERNGWVNREELYDFHGRNRKPQIALAKSFGFDEYSQPAGGCCFLTDANYSNRFKDLWQHRDDKYYEIDDIMLLKIGRHIRPNERFKLIVSREEGENNFLEGYRKEFIHFRVTTHPGPLVLLVGTPNQEDLNIAAKIVARYSKGKDSDAVGIEINDMNAGVSQIEVKPYHPDDIPKKWML